MNLPVDSETNGSSSKQETNKYVSSTTYESSEYFAGGAGDDDYYYLYEKSSTSGYQQYIYYNRVHKDQLWDDGDDYDCDVADDITDAAPYVDKYVLYWDGTGTDMDSSSDDMCRDFDEDCNFVKDTSGASGSNGDWVYCDAGTTTTGGGGRGGGGGTTTYEGTELYFVSANFHNFLQGYYRYTVLETVMRELIDTGYDINLALARFNGSSGGYIIKESVQANDETETNKEGLLDAVNGIYNFSGNTPLTETLWEMYLYLAGSAADFGESADTVSAAYTSGTTYNSPIEYECQQNHVVLLTDGEPTSDTNRDDEIESADYTNSACSGNCLDEFAGWMHTDGIEDIRDDLGWGDLDLGDDDNTGLSVHTIGFGDDTDSDQLELAASNGGGSYYAATNADELLAAFENFFDQTEFEKDTFVAPAVAVNSYSGLTHRDELYYALFQPTNSPRWTGNIKKYKLVDGEIVDADGDAAVDDDTGYFDSDSLSYWTTRTDWDEDGYTETDGADIELGGFAYELTDPDDRTLFTYIGGVKESLEDSNTDITTDLLGLDSSDSSAEDSRTEIITWARGGSSDTPNYYVGDIIHNQPSVVTYYTTTDLDSDGTTTNTFDDTVYAATNLGLLHALDADDTSGAELFAFIPEELLPNLQVYYENLGTFSDKIYGLDGETTIWRNDSNENGNIVTTANGNTAESGDFVYLYQPMRRGGTSIYALDVTARNAPTLMWQIDGGTENPDTGFEDLAQTWSTPQLANVQWNCADSTCGSERTVLFFGGGYDTAHDSATSPTSGDKGNAIYMVDAETGDLLWSAGNGSHHDLDLSDMQNSIPAEVTPVDIDGDDYVDYLFAIDILGNIWRIDFDDTASSLSSNDYSYGGKIAELGNSGTNFRRFYNAVDVAYFTERGASPFLTLSVASGYRASPNDTDITDYLFVVYDTNPLSRPTDSNGDADYNYVDSNSDGDGDSTIDMDDDMTDAMDDDTDTTTTDYGWYLELAESGEKGLSNTVTFNGQLLMTTFIPDTGGTCGDTEGSGQYYILDILTGETALSDGNYFSTLDHGGIPPEPTIIYSTTDVCIDNCDDGDTDPVTREETDLVVCIGTECITDDVEQILNKSYWREN
jgi:type IV pilus assembly protein PilY1